MNYRRIATFTGWLWIITFVTSIPARLFFYAPVLDHEGNYVTGAGTDAQTFIAIGIVCMLAIASLRQDAPGGTNPAVGQGIFAVYEWTFRIGPGVFAGIGNGLILGWLMYRSGLVPPPSSPALAGTQEAVVKRGPA